MRRLSTFVGILLFAIAAGSNAQDVDRLGQLEKDMQELKLRMSKLESLLAARDTREPVVSGEGSSSINNWRKLSRDMSPDDVKALLGEPERIDGGGVAFWYYPKRGQVSFIREKVQSWSEPREQSD